MALETGTYISDLVATNPVSGDNLSQSDDHHRTIKSFILASFPNITGAMTATHTVLNGLDGRATAIEADYVKKDGSVALTGTWDASASTWSNLGIVTTTDINGGSIDGTVIGAAAAAAGTFAALAGTTFAASGAATFASTVLLAADPTTALQAVTKQYADAVPSIGQFVRGLNFSSNVTNPTTDIDNTSGSVPDDSGVYLIQPGALTKQVDTAWAVGTNAGGLDTGAFAADVTYHAWAIYRSDTGVSDILYSVSATAPTMPTNYDAKQYLHAFITETGPALLDFLHIRKDMYLKAAVNDVNVTNQGSTEVEYVLTVPLGRKTKAILYVGFEEDTAVAGLSARIMDPDLDDEALTMAAGPANLMAAFYVENDWTEKTIWTDLSSQVAVKASGNTVDRLRIYTRGWSDEQGMY